MTVLQKIIAHYKGFHSNVKEISINDIIRYLEGITNEDEKQLRDAYRAGQKRESSIIEGGLYEDPESAPDLDTYINQLKKEES